MRPAAGGLINICARRRTWSCEVRAGGSLAEALAALQAGGQRSGPDRPQPARQPGHRHLPPPGRGGRRHAHHRAHRTGRPGAGPGGPARGRAGLPDSRASSAPRPWAWRCATPIERWQAQRSLKDSEEKFAKAFMHSPVWVVISDLATGRVPGGQRGLFPDHRLHPGGGAGQDQPGAGHLGGPEGPGPGHGNHPPARARCATWR